MLRSCHGRRRPDAPRSAGYRSLVLWLLATLATAGFGGSLYVLIQRMGAQIERLLTDAPLIGPGELAEGAYGRIEGPATTTDKLVIAPGLDLPCLMYELVVWKTSPDPATNSTGWREVHREMVGGDVEVMVGNVAVRIAASQLHLIAAPTHDVHHDVRVEHRIFGAAVSRVRYVLPDAVLRAAGTLTREVDADPAATRDYREVATRFRMIGTRSRPIVAATDV